jgi:hypothetical protein
MMPDARNTQQEQKPSYPNTWGLALNLRLVVTLPGTVATHFVPSHVKKPMIGAKWSIGLPVLSWYCSKPKLMPRRVSVAKHLAHQ